MVKVFKLWKFTTTEILLVLCQGLVSIVVNFFLRRQSFSESYNGQGLADQRDLVRDNVTTHYIASTTSDRKASPICISGSGISHGPLQGLLTLAFGDQAVAPNNIETRDVLSEPQDFDEPLGHADLIRRGVCQALFFPFRVVCSPRVYPP